MIRSPDHLPFELEARRADDFRDSLGDLQPVPSYTHTPVTEADIARVFATNHQLIDCGQQIATKPSEVSK